MHFAPLCRPVRAVLVDLQAGQTALRKGGRARARFASGPRPADQTLCVAGLASAGSGPRDLTRKAAFRERCNFGRKAGIETLRLRGRNKVLGSEALGYLGLIREGTTSMGRSAILGSRAGVSPAFARCSGRMSPLGGSKLSGGHDCGAGLLPLRAGVPPHLAAAVPPGRSLN